MPLEHTTEDLSTDDYESTDTGKSTQGCKKVGIGMFAYASPVLIILCLRTSL